MKTYNLIKNDYIETAEKIELFEAELKKRGWILNTENPDFVFIIGGDGTFLRAVSYYKKIIDKIKFVPFKLGGIGFYTNKNRLNELSLTLDLIESNNYEMQSFEMLEVKNNNDKLLVVNEMKILNEKKPIYIEIYINNNFLERFHGTGLVISTSNGSTGYMKSARGAVILPRKSGIYQLQELTPVSTNKFRSLNSPLILDKNFDLSLVLEDNSNESMIIDTLEYKLIDKRIEIKLSNISINVITCLKNDLKNDIEIIRDIFIKDKEEIL
ncbi:NAD(+)/NADH kinase [Spiroplasma turonicum]|uniref:Inorganic polyphosphate/ATP-NAD kinase n=1 Tax=Spiroplasma turonicum TaxID=216946 RepID=A0A0K1P8B7_9MOLU|nr:NAD(+)/NADH kinase [Spiroplasma turonicum]AKU80142.1 inorganic polyphosphate/ATP-NAD kinase [Spiroplasma turonicum]ALX71142.1 inorganic polyphosphate/ATP-NAD kinase [Spiroplasma turonicum]